MEIENPRHLRPFCLPLRFEPLRRPPAPLPLWSIMAPQPNCHQKDNEEQGVHLGCAKEIAQRYALWTVEPHKRMQGEGGGCLGSR